MDQFEIIKDINDFFNFDDKKKISFLKQLANVVCYNKEYQILVLEKQSLQLLLILIIENKDKIGENRDYFILARLFFMCLNNCIIDNSLSQRGFFKIFFVDFFTNFKEISMLFSKDVKINKFVYSIFYNILIINEHNLKQINNDHINLLHFYLKLHFEENMMKENEVNDFKEINQWKYILFKYIIKSNVILGDNKLLFEIYLECFSEKDTKETEIIVNKFSRDQIIIFEFIRDYLELKKDNSEVEINFTNLNLICTIFLKNIENLNLVLESFKQNIFKDYLEFSIDSNHSYSINFKLFLCLVDVLSILLPIKEYREHIFKIFNLDYVLDKCYNILTITDYFYDTFYKRNKIKENFQGVPESNIFYCFQTNVFKFLANYFFSNLEAKKYYLEDKNLLRFYYLLNHMKLDKSNPFKKEWTVLVVKALCEDCFLIQNKIMELKANDIDPFLKEYLLKNNYDFKLDKDNYKLEINKKK